MALLGYGVGLTINYYEINLIIKSNFSYMGFSKSFLTYYIGKTTIHLLADR